MNWDTHRTVASFVREHGQFIKLSAAFEFGLVGHVSRTCLALSSKSVIKILWTQATGPLRLVSIAEVIRSSSILGDKLAKLAAFTATGTGEFEINLRELVIAVFVALKWGLLRASDPNLSENHVCFCIKDTSAVAWNNKHSSQNPFAQVIPRTLSLVEVPHNFFATASRIPGVEMTTKTITK